MSRVPDVGPSRGSNDLTPTERVEEPTLSDARKAAVIDEALRDFGRRGKGRRNKYEIALDALVRVEEAFDGDHGPEFEAVCAVLRERAEDA